MKLSYKKIIRLYESSHIIKYANELQSIYRDRDTKIPLAFDTETTGVDFNQSSWLYQEPEPILCSKPFVFGISMAIMSEGKINLLWARHTQKPLFKKACEILDKKSLKTAHNARYDIRVMEENGFNVKPDVDCTYVKSRIYYDRRQKHSLKALAEIICPELSNYDEELKSILRRLRSKYTRQGFEKNYINYSFIPNEIMSKYSILDSFWAIILHIYFSRKATWR